MLTSAVAFGPAVAQDAVRADDQLEEIVVTGSLIQRGGNNTAVSPIVSVSEDALRESGVATVVDALNQLPGFTVGGNAGTGGQGGGSRHHQSSWTRHESKSSPARRQTPADLGYQRQRRASNILPDAIIEGVDAITGGASAVYGSDAMSGVVNFRTVRFSTAREPISCIRAASGVMAQSA